MILHGWKVDRFGVLENFDVADLPPGITVFQGPNESGKSTLLDYLRYMLFGFAPVNGSSQDRARASLRDANPCGGNLILRHDEELFTIERSNTGLMTNAAVSSQTDDPENTARIEERTGANGTFLLKRPDGSKGDTEDLERLLGPVDRSLFETIFAFSLEELVLLKTLSAQGVQDKIYSASIGRAGRAARAWIEVLDKEAAAIWNNGAPGPAIEKILEQWRSVREDLHQARERMRAYPTLLQQEAALRQTRESLAEKHEAIRHDCARAERLIELHTHWRPIRDLRVELDDMEPIDSFVDEPEARLESCLNAIVEDRAARERFETAFRDDADELEDLKQQFDEQCFALLESVSRHPGLAYYRDRCALHDSSEMLASERTAYLIRFIDRFGPHWDEARIMSFSHSRDKVEELESWTARLHKTEAGLAEKRAKLQQAEKHLRDALDERERLRDDHHQAVLDQTEMLEQLQIRLQVKSDKLDRIIDTDRHLDAARKTAWNPIPRWWAPGSAMAGVSILEASAWSMINGNPTAAGVGLAGAMICGIGAAWWWRRSKIAAGQQNRIDEMKADLDQARKAVRPDVDENGAEHSKTAEAATGVENRARATAQAADALVLADQLAQAAQIDVDHLNKQLDESEKTWEMLLQDWDDLVVSFGFEPGLTPEQVSERLSLIESTQPVLMNRQAQAGLQARLKAENERWISTTREFLAQAGRPVVSEQGDAVVQAFEKLRDECRAETRRRARATVLADNLEQANVERIKLDKQQTSVARALIALLDEAGVKSESDFREKHRIYKVRLELKERIRQAEAQFDEQLGNDPDAESIRAQLEAGSPEEWQSVIDRAEEHAADLLARRDEVSGDLREVERERTALEEDETLPALQLRCAGLESAIEDELNRRQSMVLERELVERALVRFLEEQQPVVLKETGKLFTRLTGGRYTDVLLKEDGRRLVVRTAEGGETELDQLSLGTGELLYLCMRFGLIKSFTDQGISLPLVMDDVLVNFDPDRARSMAELLNEIAADQQILLFTCHPQTVALLQEIRPDVRVESMPGAKKQDAVGNTC